MMCASFALGFPFDRTGGSLPHFYIKIKFPAASPQPLGLP
jgi:hypothetical protein